MFVFSCVKFIPSLLICWRAKRIESIGLLEIGRNEMSNTKFTDPTQMAHRMIYSLLDQDMLRHAYYMVILMFRSRPVLQSQISLIPD